MIEKYYELGYDALALTDHGTVNYGWTKNQSRLTIFTYQYFVHGPTDELSKERYEEIRHSDELIEILKDGAVRADAIAKQTMKRVKENFGLGIE